MSPEEQAERRKKWYRDYYYRNHERKKAEKRQRAAAVRARDPEAHAAYKAAWMEANRDRVNLVRRLRRARVSGRAVGSARQPVVERTEAEKRQLARAQYARWAKANPAKTAAIVAARRARKLFATPPWADPRAIKAFYEMAARASECTGVRFDVDHFYPLKSDEVCGLHCQFNLRVIPAAENYRKHNKCP